MKLCKDCKHMRRHWLDKLFRSYDYPKCGLTTNPVTGEPEEYCKVERFRLDRCGPEGKLFEPKSVLRVERIEDEQLKKMYERDHSKATTITHSPIWHYAKRS